MLLDAPGPATALVHALGLPCEVVGGDLGSLLAAAEAARADAVVIDSYGINVAALRSVRDRVRLLTVIDDAAEFPIPAHLVVNAAPGVKPPVGGGEGYLLGTEYALLAPEFIERPERDWFREPARLLVTLGAATPAGILGTLATAARLAVPDIALDVVVGPAADQLLVNRALRPVGGVNVHKAPEDMRALMLATDLAVTAGGVTALELAATATPIVGVALARNQRANLLGLADAKALLFAGMGEDFRLAAAVADMVRALAIDAHRRRTLGERARLLVDGGGARRVADAIRVQLLAARMPARSTP